ncbi:MAG TPA: hypothetical protein VFU15_04090 [Bacteroidia bacterium]|nr:hypothetical protein [Bacteroidia bacterium]
MKKSKLIAIAIFLFTFLVPFRMLVFRDDVIDNMGDIFLLLAVVAGFFIGFGIGTNEPFDRKTSTLTASAEEIRNGQQKAA